MTNGKLLPVQKYVHMESTFKMVSPFKCKSRESTLIGNTVEQIVKVKDGKRMEYQANLSLTVLG